MSHTLAIASRELGEKRFVFYAAIGFAVIAVVVPFLPGVHSSPRETIALSSLVLAVGFTLGVALILGASIVGRDIAAGRMSFFFARPVGALAIWFGKLIAALLLVVGSFGIIFLPAVLSGLPTSRVWNVDAGTLLEIVAVFAAVLFFLAHAIGTMVRSRSAFIAADFVAAAVAAALVWLIARPLVDAQALNALGHLFRLMIFAALLAAVGAGAWQLVDGRSDRRRSHASFSRAFWGGIAVVLLLGAAFVGWIVSASLADLRPPTLQIQAAARGEWAIVSGEAPHRYEYRPTFLVSARTGTVERLRQGYWEADLSRDGKKLITFAGSPLVPGPSPVVIRDLATGAETDTHFVVNRWGSAVAANDDASRLAIFTGGLLTIYDVGRDQSLISVRTSTPQSIFFVGPDLVRLYSLSEAKPRVLSAYEVDLAHRALRKTGELTTDAVWLYLSANADGSRLIVNKVRAASQPEIVDGRTLQPIETLAAPAMFLADGRVVLREGGRLRTQSANVDIGAPIAFASMRELAPGKLLMQTFERDKPHTSVVVDLDRGAVVRREEGSVASGNLWPTDPRAAIAGPDVLLVTKSSIVRWNALTGVKTKLSS